MRLNVKYFAALREIAGIDGETVETTATNASELYKELTDKYLFSLKEETLKVAINEEYEEFDTPFKEGDIVVFIPPVAGG